MAVSVVIRKKSEVSIISQRGLLLLGLELCGDQGRLLANSCPSARGLITQARVEN